ncbi:MAG: nuclear transport factor 2 family protein [Verrucomicrobia bacterium]|nr:nuclear transport factor 2 family protein [Verrucomicrobiota bacterium]
MKTHPPSLASLPESVARYLSAANHFEAAAAAACFTADAVVHDDGKTHVGSAAIERWLAEANLLQPQLRVHGTRVDGPAVHVAATVTGSFPGSPVDLDFEFQLRDGQIAQLSIR